MRTADKAIPPAPRLGGGDRNDAGPHGEPLGGIGPLKKKASNLTTILLQNLYTISTVFPHCFTVSVAAWAQT
jgi:hypothetical protein